MRYITLRERLAELLKKADDYASGVCTDYDEAQEACADYLLRNGVIVPPCAAGQTVYRVTKYRGIYVVLPREVLSMTYRIDHTGVRVWEIFTTANDVLGSTVFLTYEEAEAARIEMNKK